MSGPHAAPPGAPDDRLLERAARSSLRSAAVEGVRSFLGARAVAELAGMVSVVVLAHLIAPAQFGVAAIALVVPAIAEVLAFEGFGTRLVQRDDVRRSDAETATALSLVTGAALAALIALAAPLLSGPFGEAVVVPVQLASLSFAISGAGVVPQALLQRQLRFGALSRIEAGSVVGGVVVGISLAVAGFGAEALVLGAVARRLVVTAGSLAAAGAVRPRLHRSGTGQALRFGAPAAAAGVMHIGKRNADYLLLGLTFSPATLGFYYRAYQLAIDYPNKLSLVLARISFPVYSRSTDIRDMFRLRTRMARVQMAIVLPFLTTYVVVAPILVPALFGDRWSPAVAPSQLLAVTAAVGLIGNGNGAVLLAAGRPRLVFWTNAASLVSYAAVILAAAPLGLLWVAAIVSAYNVVFVVASAYVTLTRTLGLPLSHLIAEVAPPAVCALPGLALLPAVRAGWLDGLWALAAVALLATAVLGLYLGLLRLAFPALWNDLRAIAASARRPRG